MAVDGGPHPFSSPLGTVTFGSMWKARENELKMRVTIEARVRRAWRRNGRPMVRQKLETRLPVLKRPCFSERRRATAAAPATSRSSTSMDVTATFVRITMTIVWHNQ